jgi:integrase
MTDKRRGRGEGTIDRRGDNSWRLRYRIGPKRFAQTFHGTLGEARKELRRLLRSGDTGEHVAPDKITFGQWLEQWLNAGAPGRRQKRVSRRTLERYGQLLRCHVVPGLGKRPLQQILPIEIDALYLRLEEKIAPRTAHHVHTVLGACFGTAARKGLIVANPIARVEKVPSPGKADHGVALDEDQLRALVDGFRTSVLFPIVATLAFTGARRNEVLALRWTDLDVAHKTITIGRALEDVKQSITLKEPKTERGKRTMTIDDELLALLCAEHEKHLRIKAGVPDGARVDLSLVKLPEEALMFPNAAPGEAFSFVTPRHPRAVSRRFRDKARKLGFRLRLHDLRGTHETLLLDAGVPVHVVADRCGHDPAELLRSYAKRTRKADTGAAAVIGALSKGVLGSN